MRPACILITAETILAETGGDEYTSVNRSAFHSVRVTRTLFHNLIRQRVPTDHLTKYVHLFGKPLQSQFGQGQGISGKTEDKLRIVLSFIKPQLTSRKGPTTSLFYSPESRKPDVVHIAQSNDESAHLYW